MKVSREVLSAPMPERQQYFVSDRPEAYEVWGEVSREEAGMLARLIVRHAAERFPNIEFRIDGNWHTHDRSTELVSAYIESHWQAWAAAMVDHRQTA